MKLIDLKQSLRSKPQLTVRMELPDGRSIPAHYHVTEVAGITKRSIDCGGLTHAEESHCLLQIWLGEDVDHRVTGATVGKILDLSSHVLPGDEVDVVLEYEDGALSQFPLAGARQEGDHLVLQLAHRHTACLARDRARTAGAPVVQCCGATAADAAKSCC